MQVETGIVYDKDSSIGDIPPEQINELLANYKLRHLEAEAEADALRKELEQVSTHLDPASFKVI